MVVDQRSERGRSRRGVASEKVSVSGGVSPPSASVALIVIEVELSSSVLAVTSSATGVSLTALTVIETVAVLLSVVPSFTE